MLQGALIGCGYVSGFHLAAWQRQTLGRVVALCDTDESRARIAAEKFGIQRYYPDAKSLFQSERLDFVEICTRPESHETLVQESADAGVPVLCQKPIAADLATIDRMLERCTAAGVRIMVHENWRFRPWYLAMARLLHDGIIGNPIRLRINVHDWRCLAPGGLDEQPYFAPMPHFILYEMGPHPIDTARHLFGEPTSVYCRTGHVGPQQGEDSAHLVLGYADGRTAILDLCWATRPHPADRLSWGLFETVIEGTDATLRTAAEGDLALDRPMGEQTTIPVDKWDDPRLQSYALTQQHFLECLISGVEFQTSLADNRKAMSIVFAAYKSAETGHAIIV